MKCPVVKCPVCKLSTGYHQLQVALIPSAIEELIKAERLDPVALEELMPAPLYQQSYLGESNFISPRCLNCFDKALRKHVKKLTRTGGSGG